MGGIADETHRCDIRKKLCEVGENGRVYEEVNAEYRDLCDHKGNNLGEQIIRGQSHPTGTYHIVVCVWIRNAQGQVLLTLRSQKKKQFPGIWEAVRV